MPELPEVETTARGLNQVIPETKIQEMRIYDSRLRWPVDFNMVELVKNASIGEVLRRSKYLLIPVYKKTLQGYMMIHLGMSGRLQVVPEGTPREKHSHLEWFLNNKQVLRYTDPRRFGSAHWLTPEEAEGPALHPLLASLGPEPLEKSFSAQYLFDITRTRSQKIKVFIMNAHIVVGVGNIYASESLFTAGIHPERAASSLTLDECKALVKAIKATLKKAIKAGGTTLKDFQSSEGKPGYFQQELKVYGREGLPCPNCKREIQQKKLGQRASFYCEHCQV